MKLPFLLLFVFLSVHLFAQHPAVELRITNEVFTTADTIRFDVVSKMDVIVEVSVFSENELLLFQKDKLREGEHTYRVLASKALPGDYTILISGEGIHEERRFSVK